MRRQQDSQGQAIEARAMAKQAQESAHASDAKLALRFDVGDGKMPKWNQTSEAVKDVTAWTGKLPSGGRIMIEVAIGPKVDKAPYVLKVMHKPAEDRGVGPRERDPERHRVGRFEAQHVIPCDLVLEGECPRIWIP